MPFTNEIFQWEGDTTQALRNFIWRSKQFVFDNRPSHLYGVILFDQGDLADYNQAVADWEDAVRKNRLILQARGVFPDSLPDGSGFGLGVRPITGTTLVDPGPFPTYTGDLTLTLRVYVNEILSFTKTIINQKPFRIGTRKRGRRWSFEIEGNVNRIKRMDFASSMDEIKAMIQEGG